MRLLELYIEGNKRLLDKKTNIIDWDIQSDIQLLIGGNGFGKSTLSDEFSPLPAIAKNYTKNGIKRQLIEHENKQYRLESNFGAKHKHSFWDLETGDNLNKGGTITVQTDLVKRILGYTAEIHNILKGNVRLSTMSIRERKDFFSRVSDVSVDYALGVYEQMRGELRNLQGVQKYNKQKIFEENKKMLSDGEIFDRQKTIAEKKKVLSEMVENKFYNLKPVDASHLTALEEKAGKMAEYIVSTHLMHTGFETLDDLLSDIRISAEQKEQNKLQLKHVLEKIDLHKSKLESINSVTEYPTEKVKEDMFKLADEIEQVEQQEHALSLQVDHCFRDLKHIQSTRAQYDEDKQEIQEILMRLGVSVDNRYDDVTYLHWLNDNLQRTQAHATSVSNRISANLDKIKHIESHDPVTCDECNHQFVPGVNKDDVPKLRAENEELAVAQTRAERSVETIRKKMEEVKEYQNSFDRLRQLTGGYLLNQIQIDQKPFSEFVLHHELRATEPASLAKLISPVSQSLAYKEQLYTLNERKDELFSIVEHRTRLGITDEDAKYTNQVVHELEDEYQRLIKELAGCDETHQRLTKLHQRLLKEQREQQQLSDTVARLNEGYVNLFQGKVNTKVEAEVFALTSDIQKLSEEMSRCDITKGVVSHLEGSLKQVEEDIELYQIMLESLGPQKGLIGKSLISFTNYFVEKMNEVIGSVWKTPLTIQPMTVTPKGFTYQFGVVTYDARNVSADVSAMSSGETEIIDFAFTLITASCLGLSNYPLLLDEVGKFFKADHKVSLYDYLKLLAEHNKASTIVLVSHFIGTYEALTRADVCRIDPMGIETQEHENKFFKVIKV